MPASRAMPALLPTGQASRHAATYARIFLDPDHNKAEQLAPDCLRCHGMFYAGHIEDLVGPLDVHGPWALKDESKKTQAAIPCLACHQIHTPAAESGPAQLYVRHEESHFSTNLLPATPIWQGDRAVKVSSDPRQRLCVQCHAPNAFRQLGSERRPHPGRRPRRPELFRLPPVAFAFRQSIVCRLPSGQFALRHRCSEDGHDLQLAPRASTTFTPLPAEIATKVKRRDGRAHK